MTVNHIIMIQTKPGVTEEQMEEGFERARNLVGKVPGLLDVKFGRNFTDRAAEFSYGGIITLTDREALAGYGPHPAHQEVAAIITGLVENLLVLDFES
jgi:hypothetical protein